ncbi:MAG: NAD-dependent alcohol dehydrogenase [Chloroflexi bacterium]|nr:MAG: NAD-dependent alcohol dehydrogenase [Chloroflexota bacterium]
MWQFKSPFITFGQDALDYLDSLRGRHAFIVTDANLVRFGLTRFITEHLTRAGLTYTIFDRVESEPSLQTVRAAAQAMTHAQPDWIIGLGGGSCIDAAKGAWLLYERPDVDLEGVSPMEQFGLRAKAKLIAIPTTSGTGAETTLASVLTDVEMRRKVTLGSYELVPDVAIVDPQLVMQLPPSVTADTGMDALTHAVEGYSNRMRNDFSDGLALNAIRLVLEYLPRAFADGSDAEAREHMHNAATIAGLAFGNSQTGLAHALGHSFGALFKVPHGRAVSLFLPYVVEYEVQSGMSRYADIAHTMRLDAQDETQAARAVAARIRALQTALGLPQTLQQAGATAEQLTERMPQLIANAEMDTQLVMNMRVPDAQDLERLFRYAFEGRSIDF